MAFAQSASIVTDHIFLFYALSRKSLNVKFKRDNKREISLLEFLEPWHALSPEKVQVFWLLQDAHVRLIVRHLS